MPYSPLSDSDIHLYFVLEKSETIIQYLHRPKIGLKVNVVFPSNPTDVFLDLSPETSSVRQSAILSTFVMVNIKDPNSQPLNFRHSLAFDYEGKRYSLFLGINYDGTGAMGHYRVLKLSGCEIVLYYCFFLSIFYYISAFVSY